MANRYFKAAGGNWNDSTKWSATGSGGADNAGVPTAADEAILEAGSGALSINAGAVCRSFNASSYTNTISHEAFTLTIGDGTAPVGGVAFVLNNTCTYTPNVASSIVFSSYGTGIHTINTGGKTIQAITFLNQYAEYKFITNNVILTGGIAHSNSSVDYNGLSFTIGGQLAVSGSATRIVNFNSSVITFTGGNSLSFSGSNYTLTNNTALFIFSNANPAMTFPDGTNFNGSSFKATGGPGAFTISNTCTIANLIIDPTTTKTLAIAVGKTATLTGQMYCCPKAGVVIISNGTISKASGTVNLYQVSQNTCVFTGSATWNLKNNCSALGTLGLTQAGGKFYIDLDNGDDSIYAAYGWSKVAYTGATGTMPVLGETIHGETSGSTATVSYIDADWFTGSGTIWINTKSAAFQSETVHGNTGDGHFNIAADFVNGAWKTISGGALAARIAQADINNISKTTNPTSIGNGKWTLNTLAAGGFDTGKNVSATANASGQIRVTTTTHGFSDGDVVQMLSVGGTVEANGAWVISLVSTTQFDLVGSVYTNAWTSGGTAQRINSKAIVLTTAGQMNVDRCMINWSNGATGVSSIVTTDHKDGGRTIKCLASATPGTNTRQIYNATGTLAGATMNGYQKLSFWIKNEVAIADATTWYVGLCSDTAGATVVDTFPIPPIPSTGRWIPLTIARSGGGNLGGNASTDVKSIAIWSGATSPTASKYIYVSNFIACATSGLNLQSLISKNGATQGGTGSFYGIQSINGNVVLVDVDTNTLSNTGRGYYEASGSPTTYIRETFKTALASSASTVVSNCLDNGVSGNLISYEFGWTINGAQDGETFLDGLNGNGYGIQLNNRSYNRINKINTVRYNYGVYLTSSKYCNIGTINNANNCSSYGVYLSTSSSNIISSVVNANNNYYYGIRIENSSYNKIGDVNSLNNNGTSGNGGLQFLTSSNNTFNSVNAYNNVAYAVLTFTEANFNKINTLTTGLNSVAAIYSERGVNYIRNANLLESTNVQSPTPAGLSELWSFMENGEVGNNWGYFYGATANWQTTTKYSTNPGSWKVSITNAERSASGTVPLKIGEVYAPEANKLVTVTCYVKKDHATYIAAKLIVYADSVLGVVESYHTKASDTDWELLTITYTPTIANTVVDVYIESWWVAASSNVYCGPITVTQAP